MKPRILNVFYRSNHGDYLIDELSESLDAGMANELVRVRIADQWLTVMKQRVIVHLSYDGEEKFITYYEAAQHRVLRDALMVKSRPNLILKTWSTK